MANGKAPNRTRYKIINFRVAPNEYARIKSRAASAGASVSGYLRTLALTGKITMVPGMADAAGQLRRIGVNLNQLTRAVNEGSARCVDLAETKQEVAEVWRFLNSQTPKVL